MSTETRPKGAFWDGHGVRFRLISEHAEAVDLCLFDDGGEETGRYPLERASEGAWEVYLDGHGPGLLYGYRVDGPYDPASGHHFNPAKLVADPYALALTGEPTPDDALFGSDPDAPSRRDPRDSAPFTPRSVVVDTTFDWEGDRPPCTSWADTVVYECHVRGMTRLHPEVPEELRGTYLGLAAPPVVEHLRALGVTAVELMPVQQIASEPELGRRGLSNYFGYSPLGFLAPHAAYATAGRGHQVLEFKQMVKRLHRAGLEVLLDVVFNHTAEGGRHGPTLSLRGIDNRSYYRLDPSDPSRYEDFTGCGNTLDLRRDAALGLVVDALVYWVSEMRVDGFRFDLAPVLARADAFDPDSRFFERLREHPALAGAKLIAEPWDLGPGGYRLGEFPPPWRQWNDRYRDAVRSFWRGDRGTAEAMRRAITGRQGIFEPPRDRSSSIDFVTCHDGFTLEDLVSYERKHNRANGEDNRDGRDENLSRNWGVEGPTEDGVVLDLRRRAKRNLLATLAVSAGVPMLCHGDELGRTQLGNNNAYCQDSALTWIDWELGDERRSLLRFARRAMALRREVDFAIEPKLLTADGSVVDDLTRRRLPLFALWRPSAGGGLLTLVNATDRARLFRLPTSEVATASAWRLRLATFRAGTKTIERPTVRLPPYALMILEPRRHGSERTPRTDSLHRT